MRDEATWAEFVEDLCDRFGEQSMVDTIEDFNKLKQKGPAIENQVRFVELRSLMLNAQPTLAKQYFVSSLVSDLKDELRQTIRMMQPATIKQAAEKARLQ